MKEKVFWVVFSVILACSVPGDASFTPLPIHSNAPVEQEYDWIRGELVPPQVDRSITGERPGVSIPEIGRESLAAVLWALMLAAFVLALIELSRVFVSLLSSRRTQGRRLAELERRVKDLESAIRGQK